MLLRFHHSGEGLCVDTPLGDGMGAECNSSDDCARFSPDYRCIVTSNTGPFCAPPCVTSVSVAQDEALQEYLEQMSQMLTDKERPLRRAQPGDDLSTVARARTLTVLTRLDDDRKGTVVRFLP